MNKKKFFNYVKLLVITGLYEDFYSIETLESIEIELNSSLM